MLLRLLQAHLSLGLAVVAVVTLLDLPVLPAVLAAAVQGVKAVQAVAAVLQGQETLVVAVAAVLQDLAAAQAETVVLGWLSYITQAP